MSDIQIDCLMRKLAEVGSADLSGKCSQCSDQITSSVCPLDGNKSLRDSDAILVIKKLQEKVSHLLLTFYQVSASLPLFALHLC